MRYLIVCCVFLLTNFASAKAQVGNAKQTAEVVLSACRDISKAQINSDGTVGLPMNFDTGRCWGAFSTLPAVMAYVYNAQYAGAHPFPYRVCSKDKDVTVTQMIAIFTEYANRHPERYQDDFLDVALDAMRAAFPCPTRPAASH